MVSAQVGKLIKKSAFVCIESTVAPGTTENIVKPILEKESGFTAGKDFYLVFSYERVMIGRLLHNIQNYPRIVGGITPECAKKGVSLYKNIVNTDVIATTCLTAEVSKTVENAYRDVNIAFANEIALMCESLGVDKYGKYPVESKVIVSSREVNDYMPVHMAGFVIDSLKKVRVNPGDAKITILGYAFLEDSDDTRNTPAEPLIRELKKQGISEIVIHDPFVREEELPEVQRDIYKSLEGSDCACIVTKHSVYKELNLGRVKQLMKTPIIVDGRNIFNYSKTKNASISLIKLGDSAEAFFNEQPCSYS
ncbi:MAG: hypothetical protein GXP33_05410 [Spirochaetes bacterium]|nr:hypothetical protein [Spirochaetota bacterium]